MIKYKNYTIKPNSCGGFILSETRTNDKGESYDSGTCYPATLKGCLTKIVNWEFAKVIDANVLDLKQAINELDNITKHLEKTLKGLIKEEF